MKFYNTMTKEITYTENFFIHSYDTAFDAKVKPGRLCGFLHETAGKHASELGFGYQDLSDKNSFWVLSRFFIRIHNLPHWRETISVKTWPRGVERLFGLRDFEVRNPDNKVLAQATSYWLILDKNTHRPIRPTMLSKFAEVNKHLKTLDIELDKMGSFESKESKNHEVQNSEIDMNMHVNNTGYIDWIFNFYPLEFYKNHHLKELQINYLAETKPQELVQIKAGEIHPDGTQYFEAYHATSGAKTFQARVLWE